MIFRLLESSCSAWKFLSWRCLFVPIALLCLGKQRQHGYVFLNVSAVAPEIDQEHGLIHSKRIYGAGVLYSLLFDDLEAKENRGVKKCIVFAHVGDKVRGAYLEFWRIRLIACKGRVA